MSTFRLVNPKVRANALEAVRTAPDGWLMEIKEPKRTLDQGAMFHAICGDVAKSGFKFMGKPRSAAVWKRLLVSGHAVATEEPNEIVPGLEGEFVNIRESTALMSVRRAGSLITYTLAFCDTNGIAMTETRKGGFIE